MKNNINLDKTIMILPISLVIVISIFFTIFPNESLEILDSIRNFLGNDMGLMYLLFGVFCFGTTMYMGFGNRSTIKLGKIDKPLYKNWIWGSMIFTSTMAADIIFFSLIEWAYYANESYVYQMDNFLLWTATMPLFHWGPLVWSFYIVLSVSIGFMIHNKGVMKHRLSEMCRGILGNKVDGYIGKTIDTVAVFGLIAAAGTTFSLATPLITEGLAYLIGVDSTAWFTVFVLIIVASIYTIVVITGMKGIEKLAKISVISFIIFLLYVLILGGETRFILETGLSSLGNMTQNFINLSTWTDPLRENYFPQNWTVFYLAYWVSWSVTTPFFIATISKGRTIKNTVFGSYLFGLLGTFTSFIILGGHGMAQQFLHGTQISNMIGYIDESFIIIGILQTIPLHIIGIFLLITTMILFYATTFDSLTLVISNYSYISLKEGQEPSKGVKIFWSITFIILPIALIMSEGALYSLQALAIIAAAPISIIMILVIISFFKISNKK